MNGLIAVVMTMTCFLSNVSALELDIPTTPITLGETITITDLQNEDETIYEFEVEEDCVMDMNLTIDFKDDATKDITAQVINEAYMQDIINGLMGNETSGKEYCAYGETTTISSKTYQFHQQYKMEKGVYWFSLSCLGEIDYENFEQAPVKGKAKLKFSVVEDDVQYVKVKYSVKESKWFDPIKPITLTTVKGFKSPLSTQMLFLDEGQRPGYYLEGFYVYRNRRLIERATWFKKHKKEHKTQLLRIRIDIPAELDEFWEIDVRKSQTTPPSEIQNRVALIVEHAMEEARCFWDSSHRNIATRAHDFTPAWSINQIKPNVYDYLVNKEHSIYKIISEQLSKEGKYLLRFYVDLLSKSFPYERYYSNRCQNADEKIVVDGEPQKDEKSKLITMLLQVGVSEEDIGKILSNTEL